ncbi:hypothetical protein ACHAWF_003095 [Thalassiosira exigua]
MTRFAIVTGANAPSLGFRAAQMLAAAPLRFHVVLACRDERRGLEARESILAADPGAKATFAKCDLADLASVRSFVDEYRSLDGGEPEKRGLSVLLLNAGVGFASETERRFTKQDFEEKIGVNHLGHFLLTNLLLPDLRRAEAARVVAVSSSLHDPDAAGGGRGRPCTLDLDDLHLAKEGAYDSQFAYKRSKLANLLFAYELKRRLAAEGCSTVHVSAVSPGFVPSTNLGRDAGAFGQFFMKWILDGVLKWIGMVKFTRTIDEGATAEVLCATSDECVDGGYHRLTEEGALEAIKSSAESYDKDKARELWKISTRLTGSDG